MRRVYNNILRAWISVKIKDNTDYCRLHITTSEVETTWGVYSISNEFEDLLPMPSSPKTVKRMFRGSPQPRRRQLGFFPGGTSCVKDVAGSKRIGEKGVRGDASTG
jgi:hypothetical protein